MTNVWQICQLSNSHAYARPISLLPPSLSLSLSLSFIVCAIRLICAACCVFVFATHTKVATVFRVNKRDGESRVSGGRWWPGGGLYWWLAESLERASTLDTRHHLACLPLMMRHFSNLTATFGPGPQLMARNSKWRTVVSEPESRAVFPCSSTIYQVY